MVASPSRLLWPPGLLISWFPVRYGGYRLCHARRRTTNMEMWWSLYYGGPASHSERVLDKTGSVSHLGPSATTEWPLACPGPLCAEEHLPVQVGCWGGAELPTPRPRVSTHLVQTITLIQNLLRVQAAHTAEIIHINKADMLLSPHRYWFLLPITPEAHSSTWLPW